VGAAAASTLSVKKGEGGGEGQTSVTFSTTYLCTGPRPWLTLKEAKASEAISKLATSTKSKKRLKLSLSSAILQRHGAYSVCQGGGGEQVPALIMEANQCPAQQAADAGAGKQTHSPVLAQVWSSGQIRSRTAVDAPMTSEEHGCMSRQPIKNSTGKS
jgi:hypothetical protein